MSTEHIDAVNLQIVGERGPGQLLGNLLCAVTGLLDTPGNRAVGC